MWTYRRKIGTFRRKKLDAESEYLAEISLFNQKCTGQNKSIINSTHFPDFLLDKLIFIFNEIE